MSRADVSRFGSVARLGVAWLAIVTNLLLTVPLASQKQGSPDLQQHVPDAVMTAAANPGPPEQFGHALASLHVPAGVVLAPRDWNPADGPSGFGPKAGEHVLRDAVVEFQRTHPEYLVEGDETGLFVAPRSSGCLAPLDRIVDVEQSGALNVVLWRIAQAVDPTTPDVPPSIVGGGAGLEGRSGPDLFAQPVRSRARNASLRSTLMDLSSQVPGIVWGVRESPGRDGAPSECTLTLLTSDRTLFTSYRLR